MADVTLNLDHETLYLLLIFFIFVIALFIMWGIIFRTKFEHSNERSLLSNT